MEFLALVSVLVLGMVLGWMLAQDSKKRLEYHLKSEMAEALDLIEKAVAQDLAGWTKMAQELESELRLEKAKAKARQLAQEN